ncbi:nickel-responsive transcriptional regulator NikR [Uliginosibacterium sp. H3]|uniref:Putative nickel-responsive regulator n=1 Tax=Uliginosibacterium silvisoli TaxID=3114758 RepID=A0ABU6K5P8_9RHOO|nr:nickel-responsive transcriptional regulator NikR [Uliginosibacterium sp. H3]
MQRLTISLDDELASAFEELMQRKGYANRSEAVRDLLRRELGESSVANGTAKQCVAVLSYVYDHHERRLAERLTDLQHDHHDMTMSTMHAHLDHETCIETVFLKGQTTKIVAFAEAIKAETGVRHGNIHVVPVEAPATRSYVARKNAAHTHR